MKNLLFLCLVLSLTHLTIAQTLKGDRTMAWQVDMAENANYDSAYSHAINGCMESVHVFFPWSGIEPNNGNFDQNFISNTLDIIDIYHPIFGIKAELQIATINTVAKEVPADLLNVPFDDPVMIDRFKALLDTLFAHIPNLELSALSIGNEADVFWGTDALKYAQYKTFLDSIRPYAKQLYSSIHGEDLNIGTTFTHNGLTANATSALCASVNNGLDIVSTTYYPLEANFTMKDPSAVFDDFDDLVSVYSDPLQPIYFVECGYSSSELCLSSEEKQATFYENVFAAWDTHYDNVKYISVFKTNDWSRPEVNEFANYYGLQDTIFKEYLRTLGVRTWDGNGTSKLAYEKILCELNARNWCEVDCSISGIEEAENELISIYPNPTSGNITIDLGEAAGEIDLTISNSVGQIISSQHPTSTSQIKMNIDAPQGLYFLKAETADGEVFIRRVVKQ